MKRKFTFLTAAFMLLAFLAVPLGMRGQTRTVVTYTFSEHYSVNTVLDETPISFDQAISATFNKRSGGTATQYYTNGYAVRWYGGGTLAFVATDATMSEIEITYTQTANSISASVGTYSLSNSVGTWTGSASSVTFTQSGTSGHCRISAIKVTYSSSSTAVATTTTIDDNDITNTDIADGTAAGSLSATVTYDNGGTSTEVPGATVTWSGDNDAVATINPSTGAVTLVGMGTVTFTASYAGEENKYQASSDTYEMTVTDSRYEVSTLEFTAACGGSGTADDGAEWTVTSDGTESVYDATSGIHYGTNSATVTYVQLATTDINGIVSQVVVNTRDAQATASVTVTVGGTSFECEGNTSVTATNTSIDYTFTGTGSGEIVVRIDRGSSMTKAIYVKRVVVVYEPTNDPSISVEDVEIAYDATSGSIAYIINNPVTGGAVTSAVVTASNPSNWLTVNGSNPYTSPISLTCEANSANTSKTATVTLTYTYNTDETKTKNVTVTQVANPNAPGSVGDPYTVAEALAADPQNGVYVSGIISEITEVSTSYHNATYKISDDGTQSGEMTVFRGRYLNNTDFTSEDQIQVGDVVTVYGDLSVYSQANQLAQGNYLVSLVRPVKAATPTFSPAAGTYYAAQSVTIACETDGATIYYTTNGSNPTTESSVYSEAISVSASTTIKAFAVMDGMIDSDIATAEYTIILNPSIIVDPDELDLNAEEHNGTLSLTYANLTITAANNFAIQYYDAEDNELNGDDEPDWIDVTVAEQDPQVGEGYVVSYYMLENEGDARTAYFKVFAMDGEEFVYSNLVTVSQDAYVADFATLPFEFDGGKADIETTPGLTQTGITSTDYTSSPKLKFDNQDDNLVLKINETPGVLTFAIKGTGNPWTGTFNVQASVDGQTYTNVATYTDNLGDTETKTIDNLASNVRYIRWYFTAKDQGCNVGVGAINLAAYVAPTPAITVADNEISVSADEYDGTLTFTVSNMTITDLDNLDIQFYNATGQELNGANKPNWILFDDEFAETNGVYSIDYTIGENTNDEARVAYLKVYTIMEEVYSNLVTVSQAAPVAPPTPGNWVLTPFADLTPADVFVIVGTRTDATYGGDYAMSNDNGTSAPSTVAVTVDNGALSGEIASNIQWNLTVSSGGYTFYPAGHSDSYLYCTNTNNGVKVGTGDAKHFNLSDDGYLTTTETSQQRYIGIYNAQDWRCYTSSGGNIANQTFTFYKKVSADVTCIKENIVAYTPGTNDRYYLIASPVASVTPSSENGFLNGTVGAGYNTYDLYYFDESQDQAEWRNYEATSFNLVSGKGYLYANGTGTDLTFTGQPYNGNGLVELAYTPGNQVAGWNLIGNPYATNATLSQPYYRLNDNGSALKTETESTAVAAMEGVFVHATEAGQTAVFTASRGGSQAIAKANLQVVGNNGTVIDNAIVRFDNGETLEKFIFGNPAANIYFAQDGKDYAIVRSDAQGEMPVNFKAAENGIYTISVEAENLSVEYLHLIDNMTGANVDLLATPSYTFEARKNDYASRFRLVFNANAGNSEVDDDFAFVSDGNIVISNEGEATLQVIDMLGRVISTQIVNGSASIENIGVSGVYVLRLVNGNNVKTQRIVVR